MVSTFQWPVRVYYEDTDAGGVVYHSNYLSFTERARTEWLRKQGFEQDELIAKQGVLFAVRSVQIDYSTPARFNQELRVSVVVEKIGRASVTLVQKITSIADDVTYSTATIKIACLDSGAMKPVAIPESVRVKMSN